MENEKLDQQLIKIFQKFWDENHIRVDSASIKIRWTNTTSMAGPDMKIYELTVKTD